MNVAVDDLSDACFYDDCARCRGCTGCACHDQNDEGDEVLGQPIVTIIPVGGAL